MQPFRIQKEGKSLLECGPWASEHIIKVCITSLCFFPELMKWLHWIPYITKELGAEGELKLTGVARASVIRLWLKKRLSCEKFVLFSEAHSGETETWSEDSSSLGVRVKSFEAVDLLFHYWTGPFWWSASVLCNNIAEGAVLLVLSCLWQRNWQLLGLWRVALRNVYIRY